MKVKIHEHLCSGHGRCWHYAGDFYELDDNGYNAKRGQTVEVPKGKEASAIAGARGCPELAIEIIE